MKLASYLCLAVAGAAIPLAVLAGTNASMGNAQNATMPTNSEEPHMPAGQTYSSSGYDITRLDEVRIGTLASKLDPEAFQITQKSGTERPFCGTLLDNKQDGFYACVVCGLPLFSSDHKFTSGTGWPSFHSEYDPQHVARIVDSSMGMVRTEIECTRCGSHLGHVFPDGPPPSGERHCLNSASLTFVDDSGDVPTESQPDLKTAYFAGGCFWGIEHYFQQGPGVIDAVSGYMNGSVEDPTYKEVCSGNSGHAEAVKVVYDPDVIDYDQLLTAFFLMHDPTQLNRQGPDRGSQYRSGIYTTDEQQRHAANAMIEQLKTESIYGSKVVTEIQQAKTFYPAEDEHQDYIQTTGRACHVRDPWPGLRELILESKTPVESESMPDDS
jgi:peptide methionine sulfoxide reductase msrA/msrB